MGVSCTLGAMRRLHRLAGATVGQATAEYAILTFFCVLVTVGAIEAMRTALLNYYYDVVSVMCLPIP